MDFGEYDEVHDDPSPTNSIESRTQKCLGIVTTGNLRGSYKFLDLNTVNKLNKKYWTPMPMPYAIIKRVEYLADQEHRSGISGGWIFRNHNHEIYSDGTEGDDE